MTVAHAPSPGRGFAAGRSAGPAPHFDTHRSEVQS